MFSNLMGPRSSNIPFHTWVQWHWSWFLENCHLWLHNVQLSLSNSYGGLNQTFGNILVIVKQKISHLQSLLSYQIIQQYLSAVDQSHIYFLLFGLAIGFIIGIHIKQSTKPMTRMRALVCTSYKGAPESIAMVDDLAAPNICGAEDVLIQVKAASIDSLDIKITFGYGKVIRNQYHRYHKVRVCPRVSNLNFR